MMEETKMIPGILNEEGEGIIIRWKVGRVLQ